MAFEEMSNFEKEEPRDGTILLEIKSFEKDVAMTSGRLTCRTSKQANGKNEIKLCSCEKQVDDKDRLMSIMNSIRIDYSENFEGDGLTKMEKNKIEFLS